MPLANYFLNLFRCQRKPSRQLRHHLTHYRWPGNIHELKNVIHALAHSQSQTPYIEQIEFQQLITEDTSTVQQRQIQQFSEACRQFEKKYFSQALHSFHGNVSKTAAAIGVARPSLIRKLKTLQIHAEQFRL